MKDWKLILGVIIGSATLVMVMIFGLSKISSGGNAGTKVDQATLLDGAQLVKENGPTKVSVVVFSDVQCPACKAADGVMRTLRDEAGVQFVYRHFPLTIHRNSKKAADAVEAARQLGNPWQMLDLMFDKQDDWAGDSDPQPKFVEYAKSLGMDDKKFIEAMNSQATAATVSADLSLGDRLQITGTPSIFINGELTATQFVVDKVNQLLKQ